MIAGNMNLLLPLHLERQILLKELLAVPLLDSVDLPLLLPLLLNVLFPALPLNTSTLMFTPPLQSSQELEILAILASLLMKKLVLLVTMFPNIILIARLLNLHLVTPFIVAAILSILPVIMLQAVHTTHSTTPPLPITNKLPLLSSNPEPLAIILPITIIKAT